MGRLSDLSLATQVAVFRNRRAFDQLVREYQSPIRRFFLSQTLGDSQLSDDLSQDTFIKAYTAIGQFRGTSSFLTWLMRIAYNVWYDHCRRQAHLSGREVACEIPDHDGERNLTSRIPTSNGGQERGTLKLDIHTALAILKEEERTCITLQLIDGYSIDEISDITKMPAGTVKSHLARGKTKLSNYLRKNGYDR